MIMITLRASFKLTTDNNSPDPAVKANRSSRHQYGNEPLETSQHGSPDRTLHATPLPPEEVHVDDAMNDDVYTAHTAPNETFAPGETIPTRGTHYLDDDTVTRQRKDNAIDVD